jgi:hypothetical protein
MDEQLSTVRELSIMSPKSPPVSMRFIPEQNDKGVLKRDTNGSSDLLSQQPSRYFSPHNVTVRVRHGPIGPGLAV